MLLSVCSTSRSSAQHPPLRQTTNDKHEFEPCDQVFPLVFVYGLLLLLKNKYFHARFIVKNCSGQLLSPYFLFWEILNLNVTFAICRKRNS